jgi:hypothetical protein
MGVRFPHMGGDDRRIRELESLLQRALRRIDELENRRDPRFIGGSDGDRVEAFYLNDPLLAMGGAAGSSNPAASATVLDDDGNLTSETIEMGDIIMSPGDLIEAGSKGWMRYRNGKWKIVGPYCKPSGENPPPAQEIEPPPFPPNPIPAGRRSYQQEAAIVETSIAVGTGGGMNNENEEI